MIEMRESSDSATVAFTVCSQCRLASGHMKWCDQMEQMEALMREAAEWLREHADADDDDMRALADRLEGKA